MNPPLLLTPLALLVAFMPLRAQEVDFEEWKTLTGHADVVRSVAFSPDGSLLASGSLDESVKLWRASDGTLLRTLTGDSSYVLSVAFSPDGSLLASGSADNSVKLWRASDGKLLRTLTGHSSLVFSVAFSPDGSLLASGSDDNTIRLWRVADGSPVRIITGQTNVVTSVAFSPDGSLLASGSYDRTIRLWRVAVGAVREPPLLLTGHGDWVYSVAFSPDGSLLASGSWDNTIRLWRVAVGAVREPPLLLTGHTSYVSSVAFSPDGSLLASGSFDDSIKLWRTSDGTLLRTLTGHTDGVISVAFSPDGSLLASGSADSSVKLWRRKGGIASPALAAKPKQPLTLAASLALREPSSNDALDGEERGAVVLNLTNQGPGEAQQVQIKAALESAVRDLTVDRVDVIPVLKANETRTVEIPLAAGLDLPAGTARLRLEVSEGNGFDLNPPAVISFPTRAFQPPKLEVVDTGISDPGGNGQIEPAEVVNITVRLQNRGAGTAKGIKAAFSLGENAYFSPESKTQFDLGELAPGAFKDVTFIAFTNNRASALSFTAQVSESRGRYDITAKRDLPLNQPQRRAEEFVVKAKETAAPAIPQPSSLSIDVDMNVPKAAAPNRDAIAVVIGNKNYSRKNPDVPDVEFALRDASIMKEYLVKALGYQEGNILTADDATLGDFNNLFGTASEPGRISHLVKPGKSDLFIYYSGHGAPDVSAKKGYFVPVDCQPDAVARNGYPLELLFDNLGKIQARCITVVIDACFSGSSSSGKMLINQASPVGLRITDPAMSWPNGALFTSSSGEEVSSWFEEKKHGLFTYFFLKGLQGAADADRSGTITAGELHDYLLNGSESDGVPYVARRLFNGRRQTPGFGGQREAVVRGTVQASTSAR